MNTNLIHNILNIAAFVVGLSSIIGCTALPTGGFDCSASMLGPQWGAYAALAFGGVKLLMNIFRDGLGGLVKVQPPVQ